MDVTLQVLSEGVDSLNRTRVKERDMTVIGIEEHWTTPELAAALGRVPERDQDPSLAFNEMGDNLPRLHDIGDGRIAAMDELGIDLQILSVAPPATGPLAPAAAVSLSRELNDLAAQAVLRHPTRLRAMSTLPMADPGAAAAELERAAGLGLVGAMVYGRTGEIPLDDPRYDDLFAAASALGQPIFIHPQLPSPAVRRAAYAGFDPMTELALSTFGWGWHLEAALAALRLIVRGTFDRHPDLTIVLGHWGELLLFWEDRINSLSRIAGLERSVAECIRSNVHITSSGMLNPALLRHALSVTTIDRLLFSTDYPFQRPAPADVQQFLTAFDDDADREKFMHANARRLFQLGD
jgi:predicted TIM-barrel fold metal-dependent hydrolase